MRFNFQLTWNQKLAYHVVAVAANCKPFKSHESHTFISVHANSHHDGCCCFVSNAFAVLFDFKLWLMDTRLTLAK